MTDQGERSAETGDEGATGSVFRLRDPGSRTIAQPVVITLGSLSVPGDHLGEAVDRINSVEPEPAGLERI